jgi:hypothetical protein
MTRVALAADGGETGKDGGAQSGGSRRNDAEAANDQYQKCAIVVVVGTAPGTSGQMPFDGRGLFRRKLVIQIFPQSLDDLSTFHDVMPPRAAAVSGRGYALLNSVPGPEVPLQ